MSQLMQHNESSDSESDQEQVINKKQRKKHEFVEIHSFDTLEEAKTKARDSGYSFNYRVKGDLTTNRKFKEVFRCKSLKFKSNEKCDSIIRIVHNDDSFTIEHNQKEHSCENAGENALAKETLPQSLIDEIRLLFIGRVRKPKCVLASLRALKSSSKPNIYDKEPSITKLKYQISKLRTEFFGKGELSLSSLEKKLEEKLPVPDSDDEPFVMGYKIKYSESDLEDYSDDSTNNMDTQTERHFWFTFTSKRLVNLASSIKLVCADTTFKFVWLNFPAILIGTVDLKKQFHPLAFGFCSSENSDVFYEVFNNLHATVHQLTGIDLQPSKLLADAAWDIKNGFKKQWPKATILMCWYHASVKIKENAKKYFPDEKDQKELISDVAILQLSQSPEVFNKASQLFLEKYKTSKNFVDYFQKQWLEFNPNWYEGASGTNPSTQGGQESTHGKIKQTFTRNERLSMSEMFILCSEIVSNFSLDLRNQKPYAMIPEITERDWLDGYSWSKKKIDILSDPNENNATTTETWWTEADGKKSINLRTIANIKKMTWKNFDQFKVINFSALKLQIQHTVNENMLKVTCTCREFLKSFKCRHSIGVAIKQKIVTVPAEIKNKYKSAAKENVSLPNNSGRQRGRPKKATPALVK